MVSAPQANRIGPRHLDRRKTKRYVVEAKPKIIATSGGRTYDCRIVDVSMDGVRLQFAGNTPRRKVIALEHPIAGTLCGNCAWSAANDMGVEFQFPQRELERLLKCICLVI